MSKPGKQKKQAPGLYKTEEQLKEEAKERMAEQARIDALKKPAPPQRKKAENFWYHYKYHTIAAVFAVAMAVFFLRDVVFSPKPDATIIMAASRPIGGDAVEALTAALEERLPDRNGDGRTLIVIDNIYFVPQVEEEPGAESGADAEVLVNPGAEQGYAATVKLVAVVAANNDPLYLLDDAVYDHLLHMGAEEGEEPAPLFGELAGVPGARKDRLPLSETGLLEVPGCGDIGDLTFCVRPPSGDSEKGAAYYEYCVEQVAALAG